MSEVMEPGSINWIDLTVGNAEQIRDFYKSVVGWHVAPVEMDGYHDYAMQTPGLRKSAAGVCWARGVNEGLPPAWIVYITVEKLDESMAKVVELGGKVVNGPRNIGPSRFCIIQDPAGAYAGLFEADPNAPGE